MSHGAEHAHPNPNLHDDPSAFPLTMSLVLSALITISVVLCIKALNDWHTNELVQERVYGSNAQTAAAALHDQQIADMSSVRWIDQGKRVVGLPIDQAMKLTMAEYAAGKFPQPPAKAATPAPAGGATPAPAPAPAPQAPTSAPATNSNAMKPGGA